MNDKFGLYYLFVLNNKKKGFYCKEDALGNLIGNNFNNVKNGILICFMTNKISTNKINSIITYKKSLINGIKVEF